MPASVGASTAAMLAMKCMMPLKVPTRDGAVSITTAQYTEFGKALRAFPNVISAITAHTLCACDTKRKHSVVKSNVPAANQLRAITSLPVRLCSQSEMRPPSRTVKHAPTHGIIPTYQSDDRVKWNWS